MGLIKYPEINLYWLTGKIYGVSLVKKAMTRDRFIFIWKFKHFCDNTADKPGLSKRFYKIETFVDVFNKNYFDALNPGNRFVIDESMVPFRNRLMFLRHIKYGVKLYKLSTAEGFALFVTVYTGKGTDIVLNSQVENKISRAHAIVKVLLEDYPKSRETLFCDNFFLSISLAGDLLEMKMCGTLRKDRN